MPIRTYIALQQELERQQALNHLLVQTLRQLRRKHNALRRAFRLSMDHAKTIPAHSLQRDRR
jgi:hypothetical protein